MPQFVISFEFIFVSVNSEANATRIEMVEGCFGSAGQPLGVPGNEALLSVSNHI